MVSIGDGTGPIFTREERGPADAFQDVVRKRLTRRGFLQASVVVTAMAAAGPLASVASAQPAARGTRAALRQPSPTLAFTPIQPDSTDQITTAAGYRWQPLIGWGDGIFPESPTFALDAQTAQSQAQQFGFNCDFVMFIPLPEGSAQGDDGLLWVNHEYTDGPMMFPSYNRETSPREQVDVELMAVGASIVRVSRRPDGQWSFDRTSPFNRRITAMTPMMLSGPAAGSELVKTALDPSGRNVQGTINNCGGGLTPWGTILTAEENFNQYFGNASSLPEGSDLRVLHRRYGVLNEASDYKWERFYDRFDVAKHPNEANRFGWVVEVDPYDPSSVPMKRTALGRFKHEAAASTVAPGGQAVVYLGDDERFDYVYKFVSARPVDRANRAANMTLLDDGTLYVARFNPDGSGEWLPVVYGQGPLTAANGFTSQADVLVRTRLAGDALGATKMDRPEDVEVNPVTGKVYATMTNNSLRGTDGQASPDPANPRARNTWGHMLELTERNGDHAAQQFAWEIFMLAGDPADEGTYFAGFPRDQVSPIAAMDNISFDDAGNLWIATDGQTSALRINDGVYAVATTGWDRGQVKQLISTVSGSEVASLMVAPGSRDLFVSIQHPGEGGTLAAPTSVWPTGSLAIPTVIVVNREDGRLLGA